MAGRNFIGPRVRRIPKSEIIGPPLPPMQGPPLPPAPVKPLTEFPAKRRKRVEINGKMQSLFRRIADENGELTIHLERAIRDEAEKLMWQMASGLQAIGGVRTGVLMSSLDVEIGGGGFSAEVGAGAGLKDIREKQWMQSLALWLEHGTRPHAIGEGSKLRIGKKAARAGKKAIQEGRMHPGTRARPWVKPAYEIRRPKIVKRLEEEALKVLRQFSESPPPNMKP